MCFLSFVNQTSDTCYKPIALSSLLVISAVDDVSTALAALGAAKPMLTQVMASIASNTGLVFKSAFAALRFTDKNFIHNSF